MPYSFEYTVMGRVQGVFFRDTTQQVARDLGVRGYVRNELDGDVSGVAQGDEDALTKFKDALWKGPKHASVVGVTYSKEREIGEYEYEDFKVIKETK